MRNLQYARFVSDLKKTINRSSLPAAEAGLLGFVFFELECEVDAEASVVFEPSGLLGSALFELEVDAETSIVFEDTEPLDLLDSADLEDAPDLLDSVDFFRK